MAARHALQVVLRVPVGVEDDDRVGGGQVDADAARARREQEEERARCRVREAVDCLLALILTHRAVEALITPSTRIYQILNQIQQLCKLREEEDAMTLALELWK